MYDRFIMLFSVKADQTCVTGDLCPNNGACTGSAGSMKCTCNTNYEAKEGKCAAKSTYSIISYYNSGRRPCVNNIWPGYGACF